MNQSTDKPNDKATHDPDFAETEQIIAAIARGEMVVVAAHWGLGEGVFGK